MFFLITCHWIISSSVCSDAKCWPLVPMLNIQQKVMHNHTCKAIVKSSTNLCYTTCLQAYKMRNCSISNWFSCCNVYQQVAQLFKMSNCSAKSYYPISIFIISCECESTSIHHTEEEKLASLRSIRLSIIRTLIVCRSSILKHSNLDIWGL